MYNNIISELVVTFFNESTYEMHKLLILKGKWHELTEHFNNQNFVRISFLRHYADWIYVGRVYDTPIFYIFKYYHSLYNYIYETKTQRNSFYNNFILRYIMTPYTNFFYCQFIMHTISVFLCNDIVITLYSKRNKGSGNHFLM